MTSEEKTLYQAIVCIETEDECEKFLWDILTPHELEILVKRWQVALKLGEEETKKGKKKTNKQIAEEVGTEPATVGRVARYFKGRDTKNGLRDILEKVKSKSNS